MHPSHRQRLLAFLAFVCACVVVVGWTNQRVKARESGSEGGKALREQLRVLVAQPGRWGLTMTPGPAQERTLRAEWTRVLAARVEVLVLGQSDADHMSSTSFKDPSTFYNGFLSNSYLAYQYEVFDEITRRRGAPKLVLWDVRSGYLAQVHEEPAWEVPADDPVWYAGAPFYHGDATPPWYRDIPSLLSLAQTEFTARSLLADLRARDATIEARADTGEPFVLLPADRASISHRWLSDGSRVYPQELAGRLVPRGQTAPQEARGERKLTEASIAMLDVYLQKMLAANARVIVYAPPLRADAASEPTQQPLYAAFDRRVREVTDRRGVDFCDLTVRGAKMGCAPGDFYDELHLGRACDARVLRELASGCAPRAGAELRARVTDAVLASEPSASAR